MSAKVLVVDDEKLIRWSIKERLTSEGLDVVEASDGATARDLVAEEKPVLALLDLRLPDADGMALLKEFQATAPQMTAIVITAFSSVDSAVEAMKEGAFHYLTKPFNMDELAMTVMRALETSSLRNRVDSEVRQRKAQFGVSEIIGDSEAMQEIKTLIRKVAQSDTTSVLLLGESGTGKDLIARAIHYESARASQPFMNVTCTALTESLLESELFGHEQGAFTDAKHQKKGMFEQADKGTVFLDEIGDMAPSVQAKLLRIMEERAFKRVGGTKDIRVDIRVIAATNANLEEARRTGAFREDLYYRMSTLPIHVPPLRERTGDIDLLVRHFAEIFAVEFNRRLDPISDAVLERCRNYRWPGNVRELRNAIERAVLLSSGHTLSPDDIVLGWTTASPEEANGHVFRLPEAGCDMAEVERSLLEQALKRTRWNQTKVGELLGITRDQVRYKMSKYGLDSKSGTI